MDIRILAVTCDPDERARLEQLRGAAATDDAVITLQFASTLEQLGQVIASATVHDLILLNPLLEDAPMSEVWHTLAMLGERAQLVILASGAGLPQARQALKMGAVTYIVTAATPPELLRRILQSVVTITRRCRLAAPDHGQDTQVLEAIADAVISTDDQAASAIATWRRAACWGWR